MKIAIYISVWINERKKIGNLEIFMGLLSSTISMTRYKVDGNIEEPVIETISKSLKKYSIYEIEDEDPSEIVVGWTTLENPFKPDFGDHSAFVFGAHFVFSLRIDKKSIPSKIIKKHFAIESAKRLEETGRQFLSRNEKQAIKEEITNYLSLRIPATPNVYDLVWDYEKKCLWFFSNQKAANEELETLFSKSFDCIILRLFPYTMADLTSGLNDAERDELTHLSPTNFAR